MLLSVFPVAYSACADGVIQTAGGCVKVDVLLASKGGDAIPRHSGRKVDGNDVGSGSAVAQEDERHIVLGELFCVQGAGGSVADVLAAALKGFHAGSQVSHSLCDGAALISAKQLGGEVGQGSVLDYDDLIAGDARFVGDDNLAALWDVGHVVAGIGDGDKAVFVVGEVT